MAGDRNVRIASCLAKVEATIGTDAAPVAGNGVLLTDPLADPGGSFMVKTERPKAITGYIQPQPSLQMQGRIGSWDLKCQARGTRDGLHYQASDNPDFDPLLQAAGLSSVNSGGAGSEQVAYSLLSTGLKTATVYYYVDGKVSKLLGCSAKSVKFGLKAGGPLDIDFSLEGLYQGQTDAAFVAPTLGTAIPPTSDNATFSLWGYAGAIVRSFDWTVQNETTGARPSLSATAAVVAPRVRSRKITFQIVIENELQAAKDLEAVEVANTTGVVSWSIATGAQYNRYAFTAPAAQIEEIKYGNDKLTEIATITGQFLDSTGNDAFTLTFT